MWFKRYVIEDMKPETRHENPSAYVRLGDKRAKVYCSGSGWWKYSASGSYTPRSLQRKLNKALKKLMEKQQYEMDWLPVSLPAAKVVL